MVSLWLPELARQAFASALTARRVLLDSNTRSCYHDMPWCRLAGSTAGGSLTSKRLREIAAPFVVAGPTGARVRTRLRPDRRAVEVLAALGRYLGSLAGADLTQRCRQGRLDARERARSRRLRKQALTVGSSSRWAGAITRSSEDAFQLAVRNLASERTSLRARITTITVRLAVPVGEKQGRTLGYATQAERFHKQRPLQRLRPRLPAPLRRAPPRPATVSRSDP